MVKKKTQIRIGPKLVFRIFLLFLYEESVLHICYHMLPIASGKSRIGCYADIHSVNKRRDTVRSTV